MEIFVEVEFLLVDNLYSTVDPLIATDATRIKSVPSTGFKPDVIYFVANKHFVLSHIPIHHVVCILPVAVTLEITLS